MTLKQTRANFGIYTLATPSSPTATGDISLGVQPGIINLPDVDVFYAIQALVVGSTSDLVIDLADGDKTGSTAWTEGSPQVESATVVLGTGTSGNLNIVVTSAGMTGSPLTVPVAIDHTVQNTAALVAQKIVDTLNANAAVSGRFEATRATAAVKLTRKPANTYTVGSASVPVYLAGNADEFTIPTALGITGAASTTGEGADAGVASAGCYVIGDGEDFEGNALPMIGSVYGVFVKNDTAAGFGVFMSYGSTITDFPINFGSSFQFVSSVEENDPETLTISPAVENGLITIVVAGTAT